ncbi:MAG TPA: protein kinase, partial [Candidatus Sulfopaludibacter sp.]|nr:protein kinase [Candidatus Sulfopaludibacter sp.]
FREARSAGILSHPGIVTIYDVEQQGDLAYIAMEYVDGPTLDQMLSEPKPLASEQIFSILGQTSNALDYAHQKGIVHRDIKPANIMIAGDGTAKITDFGIAKITTSEQFTMTGSIVGTPHYMSPEQVQGQPVDGRSDQFSLAVIAYEMLTGEKPYTGEHLTTVVYKIVAEEPAVAHRINPSLSPAIEAVLRKGLSKKPDGRYRTCGEFAEALEKACAGTRNWKAMPRGGGLNEPTMADAPPPRMMPPARRPHGAVTATADRARRKSRFLPFLLAVLMAGGLLALIGWQAAPWLLQNRQAPPPAESHAAPSPAAEVQPSSTAAPPAPAPVEQKPATDQQTPAAPPTEQAPVPPAPRPADAAETKPSPMPKAPPAASRETAASGGAGTPRVVAQAVSFISSPGGATVTMDGRADAVCQAPCSLDAAPGVHRASFVLPGYQVEHREFEVGGSPLELPVVILRTQAGTLMVSSDPRGAVVLVNGKRAEQLTPAALQLAPGTYKITVEKDGIQNTTLVEIRTGVIKTLRVTLGQ